MESAPPIRGGPFYGTRRRLSQILSPLYIGLFVEGRESVVIDGVSMGKGHYFALVRFASEIEELRAAYESQEDA